MLERINDELQILNNFLKIKTPARWLEVALQNMDTLLIDHAHCERKAAATAINFISKYPERKELVKIMSPLAREELLHFEKVLQLMRLRNIEFQALPPSNYASKLHAQITKSNNLERMCDQLTVGAIIEARSCERFAALIPYLEDQKLSQFYFSLLKSEARHFENYIFLVKLYGGEQALSKMEYFLKIENDYITSEDAVFRFHSGIQA